LVEGCIERAKETAGVRYELIKRATGGVYPEKFDVDTAFRVETDADDNQRRLITVSAVFFAKSDALKHIASVDEYVNYNRDLAFRQQLTTHNNENDTIQRGSHTRESLHSQRATGGSSFRLSCLEC
jgi:hypothetical protein